MQEGSLCFWVLGHVTNVCEFLFYLLKYFFAFYVSDVNVRVGVDMLM